MTPAWCRVCGAQADMTEVQSSVATFVLVHGTGCGGWVWQRLAPLLRAGGHEVFAPTLTGVGDRSHVLPCAYIHCTGVPTTSVFAPFAAKARAEGWQVGEIATSHMAMLTAPRDVARLLQEFESV